MADPTPDLLANLQASIDRAKVARNPHDHRGYVPGCFRCDLSRHESEPACPECGEPVDQDGTWTGDCPGGSGERCDECLACSCDGSC